MNLRSCGSCARRGAGRDDDVHIIAEADFRCPDERGWQPSKQPIFADDGPTSQQLKSLLPIDKICSALRKHFRVKISCDPGKLLFHLGVPDDSKQGVAFREEVQFPSEDAEGSDSLFVHVPPFSCIAEEEQLKFLHNLMGLTASHLTT
eukprot:761600-Hanusia_phi.AAC.3